MEQEHAEGAASALAAHLQGIVKKRLHKLEQCSRPASSEDPVEAVHDLRVASRRLRAFGAVFGAVLGAKGQARLEKKLKSVTRAAGAVRDWDVQSQLLEERARRTSSELTRACIEHLLEDMVPKRRRASKKAEARLRKLEVEALSSAVLSAAREINASLSSAAAQQEYAQEVLYQLVTNAAERVPPGDGAEHAAELLDGHGNVVLARGLPPMNTTLASAAHPERESHRASSTAEPDSAETYHVPLLLGGTGIVALGIGVFAQVVRENKAFEWNSSACERSGLGTRGDQCAAVEADRIDAQRWAVISYSAGGALLTAALLTYFAAAGAEEPSDDGPRALACRAGPATLGLSCSAAW